MLFSSENFQFPIFKLLIMREMGFGGCRPHNWQSVKLRHEYVSHINLHFSISDLFVYLPIVVVIT